MDGSVVSENIRVGAGGDYANLDALVMDATNTLIVPWYQEDPELVVICGRQLLADKYSRWSIRNNPTPKRWPPIRLSARSASATCRRACAVLPG